MAAEYNLIPAHQYDKLMKIQQKMDNDVNRTHTTQSNIGGDNDMLADKEGGKELTMIPDNVKPPKNNDMLNVNLEREDKIDKNDSDVTDIIVSDKQDKVDVFSAKGETINKDKAMIVDKKKLNITSKLRHKGRRYMLSQDDVIEDITEHFHHPLRRKVKRLITYIFKFGRDIELKEGNLYYKNAVLGDVVKLIKSLFGVIPHMKGVRKLRRVLFILSVPSELYTLSTKERNTTNAKNKKDEDKKDKIEWLKY
jgi:hypothetical protein